MKKYNFLHYWTCSILKPQLSWLRCIMRHSNKIISHYSLQTSFYLKLRSKTIDWDGIEPTSLLLWATCFAYKLSALNCKVTYYFKNFPLTSERENWTLINPFTAGHITTLSSHFNNIKIRRLVLGTLVILALNHPKSYRRFILKRPKLFIWKHKIIFYFLL